MYHYFITSIQLTKKQKQTIFFLKFCFAAGFVDKLLRKCLFKGISHECSYSIHVFLPVIFTAVSPEEGCMFTLIHCSVYVAERNSLLFIYCVLSISHDVISDVLKLLLLFF